METVQCFSLTAKNPKTKPPPLFNMETVLMFNMETVEVRSMLFHLVNASS
jgi:hypothetical protein